MTCRAAFAPANGIGAADGRDRYVNVERPPASTLVVVSRLARPGWLIEVEAVAAIEG